MELSTIIGFIRLQEKQDVAYGGSRTNTALDHAVPGKNRMNSLFSDVLDIHEYTTIDIRQHGTRPRSARQE